MYKCYYVNYRLHTQSASIIGVHNNMWENQVTQAEATGKGGRIENGCGIGATAGLADPRLRY
jgi:hypothetical protein